MGKLIYTLIFLSALTAGANEVTPEPARAEMNGIKYSDYKDFTNWELVTARFRRDNGEQRFTYANKAAAESLRNASKDYPDGAVFAKISYVGEEDPAFVASVVPSGSRRIQFMVRDHKNYKDTDGWGYAVFKTDRPIPTEDPKVAAQACAACHRIVPERGLVFSQFIDKSRISNRAPPKSDVLNELFDKKTLPKESGRIKFQDQLAKNIPETHLLRALLPRRFKQVRMVMNEITKYRFSGAFGMIVPTMIKEALRSGKPAIIMGDNYDNKLFSLVFEMNEKETAANKELKCEKTEKPLFIAQSVPAYYLPTTHQPNEANLEIRRLCVSQ